MAKTYKDQRLYQAKQMVKDFLPYRVAIMQHGTWKVLEYFTSYDAADDRLDYWMNQYPYGYVDIISASVVQAQGA